MTATRAAESSEQTSSRLAGQRTRQAASWAIEAPEQAQARRDEDRVRHAVSRADESPEQRRSRSEDQRRQQAASRAAQWTFMEGEAFRYDPTKSYDSHPQLSIRRMTDVCTHCEVYNTWKLQQMLHQHNTYVHSFKTALETIVIEANEFCCNFMTMSPRVPGLVLERGSAYLCSSPMKKFEE
ncbi:unnamed protein product, partial [Didymodactylos carnosus]